MGSRNNSTDLSSTKYGRKKNGNYGGEIPISRIHLSAFKRSRKNAAS